jgi:hypothetical protein
MVEMSITFNFITISLALITILLALIYSIPILLIHRFHNFNNILTANLCLSILCCDIYWILYYSLLKLHPQYLFTENICSILIYFQMMCVFQIPLAFLVVSVNRFCSIVYHTNAFFKRKQWIILCITIQWIVGIIFSIPRIPFNETVRISNIRLIDLMFLCIGM